MKKRLAKNTILEEISYFVPNLYEMRNIMKTQFLENKGH